MRKEAIVCIVIVIAICILNYITQSYNKNSMQEVKDSLNSLREVLVEEKEEEATKQIKDIKEEWKKRYKTLAYFIEHDELEKVETNLVALEGFIEVKDFDSGVSELNKSIFVLEHIAQKYTFNLVNIF